jgi:hypothetical protein
MSKYQNFCLNLITSGNQILLLHIRKFQVVLFTLIAGIMNVSSSIVGLVAGSVHWACRRLFSALICTAVIPLVGVQSHSAEETLLEK